MPFDSTTYRPTANPLDLDAMIAWLETMPAEGRYSYYAINGCMFCQYMRHKGAPISTAGGSSYFATDDGPRIMLPDGWGQAIAGPDGVEAHLRWTYGAALSRFKALREGGT